MTDKIAEDSKQYKRDLLKLKLEVGEETRLVLVCSVCTDTLTNDNDINCNRHKLVSQAHTLGWQVTDYGLLCPTCRNLRKEQNGNT